LLNGIDELSGFIESFGYYNDSNVRVQSNTIGGIIHGNRGGFRMLWRYVNEKPISGGWLIIHRWVQPFRFTLLQ
jgi:hypothetical protein